MTNNRFFDYTIISVATLLGIAIGIVGMLLIQIALESR